MWWLVKQDRKPGVTDFGDVDAADCGMTTDKLQSK